MLNQSDLARKYIEVYQRIYPNKEMTDGILNILNSAAKKHYGVDNQPYLMLKKLFGRGYRDSLSCSDDKEAFEHLKPVFEEMNWEPKFDPGYGGTYDVGDMYDMFNEYSFIYPKR